MRMSIRNLSLAAGVCCGLAAATAMAGPGPTMTVLSRDFDFIEPVGSVVNFNTVAVNNHGTWIIEVDTDNPDTNTDVVLLRNGTVLLREGDPIAPPGALLGSFDSININNSGNSGWNFFLSNVPTSQDSGVYFNTTLLIQEGDISQAAGFTPGTPYIGFFEVLINDNNDLMVMASIDDPNIDSTVDRAIVLLSLDAAGNLATETVLAKEGDILPGQTEPVADFMTGPHSMAFNNAGQVMYIADLAGNTATDGAVYIDHTLVAQEGSPSPLPGRNWRVLGSSARIDLNNSGEYVIFGMLDGDTATDSVIVKSNGEVVVQEGVTFDAIAPYTVTAFGSGPVLISDHGDVLWYGDWNDPNTSIDTGLFINQELLLQENVTVIDGETVTLIRGITDGYSMSPDGRYIIARVVLSVSGDAVVLIDRGEQGGGCPADWDSSGTVNSNDISAFLTSWLASVQDGTLEADFDNSGAVNSNDISAFLTAWLEAVQSGC